MHTYMQPTGRTGPPVRPAAWGSFELFVCEIYFFNFVVLFVFDETLRPKPMRPFWHHTGPQPRTASQEVGKPCFETPELSGKQMNDASIFNVLPSYV